MTVDPASGWPLSAQLAQGARISARLPTAAEREAVGAGSWVPLLAVLSPAGPEEIYPADRVVVVVPR
jgi:hypothetical protein